MTQREIVKSILIGLDLGREGREEKEIKVFLIGTVSGVVASVISTGVRSSGKSLCEENGKEEQEWFLRSRFPLTLSLSLSYASRYKFALALLCPVGINVLTIHHICVKHLRRILKLERRRTGLYMHIFN